MRMTREATKKIIKMEQSGEHFVSIQYVYFTKGNPERK
jgi:hypothetical protein